MGFNDHRFVDLHVHSTASDGSLEPPEIIKVALAEGLSAISITDHDTTDGCKQVLTQPPNPHLAFLSGVEISAAFPSDFAIAGSIHVLGYDIDVHDARLNQCLYDLRAARNDRSPKIIKALNRIGIPLCMDDVSPFSRGGQTGRPHIAQALIQKGFATSIDDAFDRYIGKNGAAFVDKERIPCNLAIRLITSAGGVPVLAHPGLIELPGSDDLKKLLAILVDQGIKGIEVYYPGHSRQQTEAFTGFARDHGLLVTGGSDFHGDINPHIRIGKGTGDLFVGYRIYEELKAFNRQNK